ncbi:MAG: MmcQ/YjbR family DNA-binding protein [Bacteroidales bacterium]|nr:MmcQ/YjbR family DNA-binding protein [Bacteroidales bacterium]
MNIEQIHEYCLSKAEVTESFPFNDTALVFKVAGKMFAILDLSEDQRGLTLKCNPELAVQLRAQYPEVTAAYHMNKTYWNGVDIQGNLSDEQIREWVDHSYDEVVITLPKNKRFLLRGDQIS